MPRIEGLTLKPHGAGATASFTIDGLELAVDLHRGDRFVTVFWPAGCKLAPSDRRRVEPLLRRALDQWSDLAGGAG